METEDKDLRVCKVCKEPKVRIAKGRYPNRKDRKFVDENKRLWSGNICPECQAVKSRDNMRRKRAIGHDTCKEKVEAIEVKDEAR